MLIITSLSPNHKNKELQIDCVKSWAPYAKIFSLNTSKEIELIGKDNYPDVKFLVRNNTMEHLYKKTLVNISSFFELATTHHQDLFIINSDIFIKSLPELKSDGVTVFSRYDYRETMEESILFKNGFDAFYVPYEFLHLYPQSLYAMGNCWWDFAVPYRFLLNQVKLYYPKGRHLFHKFHENQYTYTDWLWLGEHFAWEFKLGREKRFGKEQIIQQICTEALALIKSKLIYV